MKISNEERKAYLISASREMERRHGLYGFMRVAWHLVESEPFTDGWVLGFMCEVLEAIYEGDLKKVVINVPPGCTKSLLTGVFFPAWVWTRQPTSRWITASFDGSLSIRDAGRTKALVTDPWYQDCWVEGARVEQPRKCGDGLYKTEQGGLRFATSVKGKGTGWHAHFHVVDDPVKPLTIGDRVTTPDSAAVREANEWFRSTLSSRAINPDELRQIIIMQRVAEGDLSEVCLDLGFEHVCLPMRFDPNRRCVISLPGKDLKDPRTEENQLLWPERHSKEGEAKTRELMGSAISSAQLDQSPFSKDGEMFKSFTSYATLPERFEYTLQSWDLTFADGPTSSFVVGDLYGILDEKMYLIDWWRKRADFSETWKAFEDFCERSSLHRDSRILVEAKANGAALDSVTSRQIDLIEPVGDKIARAHFALPFIERGDFLHPSPTLKPEIEEREKRIQRFPRIKDKDEVDTMTQAIRWNAEQTDKWFSRSIRNR